MPLNATPGDADANSYATVPEYRAYWAARPFNTAALALSDAQIESALEQATMVEDAAFNWTGIIAIDTQALGWPRIGMKDRFGRDVPIDVIPKELKASTSQLAGDMAASNRLADFGPEKKGITSIRAGSVSLDFASTKGGSIAEMDANIRRMSPEFYWLSRGISDAARMLLVPTWYERVLLSQPVSLDVFR